MVNNYRVVLGHLRKVSGPPFKLKPLRNFLTDKDLERGDSGADKSYWKLHDLHEQEIGADSLSSLQHYGRDGGCLDINETLRGLGDYDVGHHVENIDKAFETCYLKQDLMLFRDINFAPHLEPLSKRIAELGIDLSSSGTDLKQVSVRDSEALIRKLVGFTFSDDGYVSTSVAPRGGRSILLQIKGRMGDPAIFMNNVKHFDKSKVKFDRATSSPSEAEVLLPRGTRFKVLSAHVQESGYNKHMQAVVTVEII